MSRGRERAIIPRIRFRICQPFPAFGKYQWCGNEYDQSISLSLDAGWEIDLWGRVRRQVESSTASAQASAADLQALRLSLQAELAQNYFQLRIADAQKKMLDDTVSAYQKALELTKNRYAAGVAAKADVVQAQTQLKSTQAQAIDIGIQRAQLEHAIALLIGKAPADFSIPAAPFAPTLPQIPIGIPSDILERRPDVASAERRMAAANAQIGVAKSRLLSVADAFRFDGLSKHGVSRSVYRTELLLGVRSRSAGLDALRRRCP